MLSKDIKNWRDKLSFYEVSQLEDFPDLLTQAIVRDNCLNCGGIKGILRDGLCLSCSMQNKDKDKKISEWLLKNVKVKVEVEIPKIQSY